MNLTKAVIKEALGLETDAQLAQFFGTSKQAVSQWGDDSAAIPVARQWQAMALRPDVFGPSPTQGEEATHAA